jgi:hypothetical protein
MKNLTKKILNLLVLVSIAYGCATINETIDPVLGTWNHHLENLPQGNPDGSFTISKEGNIYSGVFHGDFGDRELIDLVIEGNEVLGGYFTAKGYRIEMTGVFEGDTFTGQLDAGVRSFRMTAMRHIL